MKEKEKSIAVVTDLLSLSSNSLPFCYSFFYFFFYIFETNSLYPRLHSNNRHFHHLHHRLRHFFFLNLNPSLLSYEIEINPFSEKLNNFFEALVSFSASSFCFGFFFLLQMEATENCSVKVAVHIRPLIGDERTQGCKECVTVTSGKPQVLCL